MLKKLTLSFLASLVVLFSFAPFFEAKASNNPSPPTPATTPAPTGTWYNQDFFSWYGKVYDSNTQSEIFGERYTAAQVQWVVYGLVSFIFNLTGTQDIFSCAIKGAGDLSACTAAVQSIFKTSGLNQTPNLANQNKSLLSLVFADRPLSGIAYTKKLIQKFKLVPDANAASVGFGFDALKPIQDMWKGARNVSFGFFVLASIIFAFMIMFRVKINPQTIITVQSAIPKVISALILVTFSYAIAGFLIDFMYVVIGFMSVVLSTFLPGLFNATGVFNILVYGQPVGILQLGVASFLNIVAFPLLIGLVLLTIAGLVLAMVFSGGFLFWIPFIVLFIAVIMMIWFSIRTIWGLLKAFTSVILLTIFAPLQIALGVLIPNFGFGAWVKSYLSQLSVFVVTGVVGYLSLTFTISGLSIGAGNINGGNVIVEALTNKLGIPSILIPPSIQNINTSPWPPLLGTGNGVWTGLMLLGVAFVLFTMIPKATELVQAFISGKPFAYGNAIGEAKQAVNWGAAGTAIYASRRRFKTTDPDEMAKMSKLERAADLIESFTKR